MQNITSIFYFVFYKDILPYVDMKFDLKLFVLVGVLAGLCDVWGAEDVKNEDDGFIVAELKNNDELKAAVHHSRVIIAVYKTEKAGDVPIIHEDFKGQLSSILVWNGKNVEKVEVENLHRQTGNLYYNIPYNGEYTVYFIFKDGGVESTSEMFSGCNCLISADLMFFNALNVIDMFDMFSYCSELKSVSLPIQGTQIKKRCICCGDAYVLWNNHEVGGLKPENTVRKCRKKIFSEISTKKN